jgi:hypothetical protein
LSSNINPGVAGLQGGRINAPTTVATPAPAVKTWPLVGFAAREHISSSVPLTCRFLTDTGIRTGKYDPNDLDTLIPTVLWRARSVRPHHSIDESRLYTNAVREYGYLYVQQPMDGGQGSCHSNYLLANLQGNIIFLKQTALGAWLPRCTIQLRARLSLCLFLTAVAEWYINQPNTKV